MRPLIYDAHNATRERRIWKRFICTLCWDILSAECMYLDAIDRALQTYGQFSHHLQTLHQLEIHDCYNSAYGMNGITCALGGCHRENILLQNDVIKCCKGSNHRKLYWTTLHLNKRCRNIWTIDFTTQECCTVCVYKINRLSGKEEFRGRINSASTWNICRTYVCSSHSLSALIFSVWRYMVTAKLSDKCTLPYKCLFLKLTVEL